MAIRVQHCVWKRSYQTCSLVKSRPTTIGLRQIPDTSDLSKGENTMKPLMRPSCRLSLCCVVALFVGASTQVIKAAPAVPDPCKLITVVELTQIAGPLKGVPKP